MPRCLLNIDLGELPGEPVDLYRLAQVANVVGRSEAWQGRQVVGVVLPVAWNTPPFQVVFSAALAAWQSLQSPCAEGAV